MAEKTEKETVETKTEKEPKDTPKLSKKQEDVLKAVEEMTVLELADLVNAMEDKFGVSAAAPVAVAAVGAGAEGEQVAEEKSQFDIVLADSGSEKIAVIKVVRGVTDLGLKEAKELVEAAPKTLKEAVPKEEAEEIKKKLEEAGAKVELK